MALLYAEPFQSEQSDRLFSEIAAAQGRRIASGPAAEVPGKKTLGPPLGRAEGALGRAVPALPLKFHEF